MRPHIKFILILFSCIGLPLCAHSESVKVGVSTPLTGPSATYGTDIKNALNFINSEILKNRFTLVFEDDKCNGKDAVSVAKKLIHIDKVKAVIGFGCSGALLSAAPIYNAAKIPAVGLTTSSPLISKAGPYIIRTCPSDRMAVPQMLNIIRKNSKRVAGFFEETDFAQDYRNELTKLNDSQDVSFFNQNFQSSEVNFRSQALRALGEKPDAVLIIAQAEESLLSIVKAVRQLNPTIQIYGHVYPGSPAFLKQAQSLAEGIIYTDFPPIEKLMTDEGVTHFENFEKQYGNIKTQNWIFALAYATLIALDQSRVGDSISIDLLKNGHYKGFLKNEVAFYTNGDIKGIDFVVRKISNQHAVDFSM